MSLFQRAWRSDMLSYRSGSEEEMAGNLTPWSEQEESVMVSRLLEWFTVLDDQPTFGRMTLHIHIIKYSIE